MKKVIALLLAGTLCLAALAGCSQSEPQGSDAPPSGSTQGVDSPDTPKDPVTVTVWHDRDEGIMQTIAGQVSAQLADDRITVVFEKKTDMPNQLKLYGRDAANRLRCAAGELERCVLWYGDRVQPDDPIRFTPLEMERSQYKDWFYDLTFPVIRPVEGKQPD